MAEGVFRHLVAQRGLAHVIETDSAGTSRYHIGEQPHHGTLRVLGDHGISLSHAARQFLHVDAERFELLVAMDGSNRADMLRLFDANTVPTIHFLLDFISDGLRSQDVPDPWFTGDFEAVYELVERACIGLLETIIDDYLPQHTI
jgi:protein-tyrosine phosphatase